MGEIDMNSVKFKMIRIRGNNIKYCCARIMRILFPSLSVNSAFSTELIQIFYQNFVTNIIISLFGCTIVYLEFSQKIKYLLVWYVTFLIILFTRFVLFQWYRITQLNPLLLKYHYYFFLLGSASTALFWGGVASIFMPETLKDQALMTMVLLLVVGANIRSYANNVANINYLLFALFPLLIWYFIKSFGNLDQDYYLTGFIFLLSYFVMLLLIIVQKDQFFSNNLNFQLEHNRLFNSYTEVEKKLENIMNAALEGLWYTNEQFIIQSVNDQLVYIMGYSVKEIIGKSIFDFMDEKNKSIVLEKINLRQKTRTKAAMHFDIQVIKKNGEKIWVRVSSAPIYDTKTNKINFLGMITDITEQIKTLEALKASEKKFRNLVEFAPYGIFTFTNEIIGYANQSMLEILHAKDESEVIGKNVFDIVHPSYHSIIRRRINTLRLNFKTHNESIENKLIALDGIEVDVETLSALINSQNGLTIQVFVHDISIRIEAEKKLFYLKSHDLLTGLANRSQLEEDINDSIKFAKRNNYLLGIVFINIDKFKNVNSNFGSNIGDRVLQAIAIKLKDHIHDIDTVARIGGDEFVILINQARSIEDISKFVQKNIKILQKPFKIERNTIYLNWNIGISIFPQDGSNADTLIKNARIAMNNIKSKGGNNIQFCSSELKDTDYIRSSLEIQLHDAVENQEFFFVYQPKISLKTNQITGFEALARWNRQGTIITPDQFIFLAENTGLIHALTEQIVDQILLNIQSWQKKGLPLYKISINLSAYCFQDEYNIITMFTEKLKKYGITANLLEIEITETTLLQNYELSLNILRQFRELGIQSSIDDFGIGYSSLSYLQNLQIDKLKIDKSFISNSSVNPADASIVKAIIAMGHSLNMTIIAEGVETKDQFTFLKENDCDEMQGFLIAKPLNEKDLFRFIKKYK